MLIKKLKLKYMENVDLEKEGNNANTMLSAGLSNNKHNWICKKDEKILIKGSWSNRLQCNGCGDWCFVHRASDGKYYCGECRNKIINSGDAIAW